MKHATYRHTYKTRQKPTRKKGKTEQYKYTSTESLHPPAKSLLPKNQKGRRLFTKRQEENTFWVGGKFKHYQKESHILNIRQLYTTQATTTQIHHL